MESQFFKPSRVTKIGLKNRIVREIGDKLQSTTEERETTFGVELKGFKKGGFKKLDLVVSNKPPNP